MVSKKILSWSEYQFPNLYNVELDRKEITDSEKERNWEEAIMTNFGIRLLCKDCGYSRELGCHRLCRLMLVRHAVIEQVAVAVMFSVVGFTGPFDFVHRSVLEKDTKETQLFGKWTCFRTQVRG
jgi:hypothetical protein